MELKLLECLPASGWLCWPKGTANEPKGTVPAVPQLLEDLECVNQKLAVEVIVELADLEEELLDVELLDVVELGLLAAVAAEPLVAEEDGSAVAEPDPEPNANHELNVFELQLESLPLLFQKL